MSEPTLTAELIRHLGRCSGSGTDCPSLTAAQWAALRFFARANRLTRTPSAFASFHGSTRGTASQTIKSLVRLGYLDRQPDPSDRRRIIFELTDIGRQVVGKDPAATLERAIEALPSDEQAKLASTIQALVASVDTTAAHTRFGYCDGCRYGAPDPNAAGSAYCTLTGEPIQNRERWSLCCAFSPEPGTAGTDPEPLGTEQGSTDR